MSILTTMGGRLSRPMRLWLAIALFCIVLFALSHPSARKYYDTEHLFNSAKGAWRHKSQAPTTGNPATSALATFESDATHPLPGSPESHEFWVKYAETLTKANLTFPKVREKPDNKGFPMITFEGVNPWDDRTDRLEMSEAEITEMTDVHAKVASSFKELEGGLPFVPGTRGIVVTTSVEAIGFMTVSLRMLRKTGTTLPVEVWIYDRDVFAVDPYGLRICEDIFKPLDAICRFTSDYMPAVRPPPLDKETYTFQNKMDAMLFSTFEQFLFLDSDNFPLMSVDELFIEEPFLSHGFVLWPDYWADTSAKYWYDITGVEMPSLLTRASSESGQLMVNKKTHSAALMMASYYVRYGATHYYQLFTQGAMGMGDKECYLKGIQVFNRTFYQISERPERLGYRCDGNERAIASGQHHPADDYFLTSHGIFRGRNVNLLADGTLPRILFIHGNLPKYDPARYLDWYNEKDWPDQLRCNKGKGKAHRMYGPAELMKLKFGWDVEKAIWDQMRWVSCETEEYMVQWWNGTVFNNFQPRKGVCKDMVKFYDELLTEQEGLKYDPSLTSPYVSGGLFEQNLKESLNKGWAVVRSGVHWW